MSRYGSLPWDSPLDEVPTRATDPVARLFSVELPANRSSRLPSMLQGRAHVYGTAIVSHRDAEAITPVDVDSRRCSAVDSHSPGSHRGARSARADFWDVSRLHGLVRGDAGLHSVRTRSGRRPRVRCGSTRRPPGTTSPSGSRGSAYGRRTACGARISPSRPRHPNPGAGRNGGFRCANASVSPALFRHSRL